MKDLNYKLQAVFLWMAFALFRALGVERASALGGWIGRTIGPHLGAARKARANLEYAFPAKAATEVDAILRDMWDNLGRVIAEYPHLKSITMNRLEIAGEENLDAIGLNTRAVLIGAHIANWELLSFCFKYRMDLAVSSIYRAPNNPYVEKLLDQCRYAHEKGVYIPKSFSGAREMVKTLVQGRSLGILIDQKYNQGIPAPFFGKPAMTSVAFAQLATKFECPIVPVQVERLKDCHFRLTFHPAFYTEGQSEEKLVETAHGLLEGWIEQHPGQWLWLHRRWNSKALKDTGAGSPP